MATPLRKRWVIELKVKAMTVAAAAAGTGAAVLNDVQADNSLMGPAPSWLQAAVLVVTPSIAVFLAGWSARHTPRPDLGTPPQQ